MLCYRRRLEWLLALAGIGVVISFLLVTAPPCAADEQQKQQQLHRGRDLQTSLTATTCRNGNGDHLVTLLPPDDNDSNSNSNSSSNNDVANATTTSPGASTSGNGTSATSSSEILEEDSAIEAAGCGTPSPTDREKRAMALALYEWKQKQQQQRRKNKKKKQRQQQDRRKRKSNRDLSDVDESDSDEQQQQLRYTIPVHFHVFRPSTTEGLVSNRQFEEMVAALNDGFCNAPFDFELTTTEHVVEPTFAVCLNEVVWMSRYKLGNKRHLNVYLCDTLGLGLIGYSNLPPITIHPFTKHRDGGTSLMLLVC